VNKYLRTVASVGFLFTLNYDARNHELKKKKWIGFAACMNGTEEKAFKTAFR